MSRGGRRFGAGRPQERLQTIQLASEDVRVLSRVQFWNATKRSTWVGEEEVAIDWQPCRFGGCRAWFICPACERRCALLYIWRGAPQCARCRRLAHPSQSMDRFDRSWVRTRKIEARLGVADSRTTFPLKRKWKHWDGYERLLQSLHHEAALRNLLFCRMNAAFMGWDPESFDDELKRFPRNPDRDPGV